MNKTEFVLGASVFLLTALSIFLFNYGIVSSEKYPGEYTYGFESDFSEALLLLLFLAGFFVTLHGARSKGFIEAGFGVAIAVWAFFAFLLVGVSLADGRSLYILAFPTPVTRTLRYIMPGIFLGIVLMLDGLRKHIATEQTCKGISNRISSFVVVARNLCVDRNSIQPTNPNPKPVAVRVRVSMPSQSHPVGHTLDRVHTARTHLGEVA
jgi:hypothetical protein